MQAPACAGLELGVVLCARRGGGYWPKGVSDMTVTLITPGFTGTDFNNHRGTQTVTEGTDAIVHLATLPPDGPTGTFQDRHGPVPW